MTNCTILMSIRPQYADKIFNRTKTVELRRIKPKSLQEDDLVLVYVSAPVKSLVGAFKVESVIEASIATLWKNVRDHAGVSKSEFSNYYEGSKTGVAIFIKDVKLLSKPIQLAELQKRAEGFYPPQSFRYTSIKMQRAFNNY